MLSAANNRMPNSKELKQWKVLFITYQNLCRKVFVSFPGIPGSFPNFKMAMVTSGPTVSQENFHMQERGDRPSPQTFLSSRELGLSLSHGLPVISQ